ncbi:23 kDa integral membrane protein [Schistosoma japonicum]|uniref:23 kDa integral membrane protein n=1 Tax=Schistosoma japonicum TaxID=6182 RepID=A0A4Z2DHH8_SCHJA|nr:23 kDa integral membrane protein [Schistosoma japonicum]
MGFCKSALSFRRLQITVIVLSLGIIACAVTLIVVGSTFYNSIRKYSDKLDATVNGTIICLVITGCIMVIAGFLGLFGSCLQNSDLLCLFFVGLISIVIVHLGTGITCVCYQLKLWDNLHSTMTKAVKNYHFNKNLSVIVDRIHTDLKCCGSLSHLEYGNKVPFSCQKDGLVYKNGCTDALNEYNK